MDDRDPLLETIEALLRDDIPDPTRRRVVAMMVRAHVKVSMVHALREKFEPYLGIGAVKPTVGEALTAMRGSIIRLAGFDKEGDDDGGQGFGDGGDDQGDR